MIYVLFVNPFIRRNRNMILYFKITHYWCNEICILGNFFQFVPEADDVVYRYLSYRNNFGSWFNQVKSFKALTDGKDVFIETKTGSGIFAYISSITCAPCKTSSDWIRVLVAVTNEILKRESSKCILDPPRVERRGTRIVTLG